MRSLFFALALSTFSILSAQAVEVGETAPCVELNNIAPNGSESFHCIRDTKAEGQYKILEFFSATCSDCAKNLPIVSNLAAELESEATTRLIGIDRDEGLLRNYLAGHKELISFDLALDTSRDAKRAYDVVATPTVFVLDPMNKVVFRSAGVLTDAQLAHIRALVKGN